jgi:hypothetical protein
MGADSALARQVGLDVESLPTMGARKLNSHVEGGL